ncbi:hypothetical protein SLS56_005740 [Neofusicoccum ribis]|uniref:Glycine zipper 2TM domain-containing protein n=1 Tax=Neofusicoccum ribis TaxID=45134 RepID=A0ABR3SSN3_9PEZI
MSDPYNQYSNQYGSPAPGGYGAPQQGYPPQQSPYQQQGGYAPPQQQYGQPGYDSQQYNQQAYQQNQQGYGGYGPPANGGFQNGQQAPAQYGQPGYEQQGYQDPNRGYDQGPSQQFPQQGAYNQNPYPSDPNAPYGQAGHNQYGATDPAQAGEGDRGIMGAMAGGAAGAFGGKKFGDHPIIGGLLGAFVGSKAEDKWKAGRHNNGQGKW